MVTRTYLILTVIAPGDLGILDKICHTSAKTGCSIIDCEMNTMGKECTLSMMFSGSWSAIAKLETQLDVLAKKEPIKIHHTRTEKQKYTTELLPYSVSIISLESPGLLYKITHFFAQQQITISQLTTYTYITLHTETLMFSLTMMILIPAEMNIPDLREQFMLFCDELNIDAILEPDKT